MPIEFTVEPNAPEPTPPAPKPINAETTVTPDKVLVDEAAPSVPSLEVDLPEVREPESELVNLTQNQQIMTQRAMAPGGHDDPAVLLQGLLSQMPGVDNSLAADMTVGTDMALYNLSAKAKRMHNLDERKRKHDERGTSKRGRRRR